MSMPVYLEAEALTDLSDYFQRYPQVSVKAVRMAINDVAKGKGMTMIREAMGDQIDFPPGYLYGDRLNVSRWATDLNPEAIITARKRATSLARFASGTPASTRRRGVTVRVKKGKTTYLKNAWLVRLNRGASLTEDNYNIGLAVRLGPGERLDNKSTTHRSWLIKDKVALIYGPSVNQVFLNVAQVLASPIGDMVAAEYTRQMARLLDGQP